MDEQQQNQQPIEQNTELQTPQIPIIDPVPFQPNQINQPPEPVAPIIPNKSKKKWLLAAIVIVITLTAASIWAFFIPGRNDTTVSDAENKEEPMVKPVAVTEKPEEHAETKRAEVTPEIISIEKGQKATINGDFEFNVNSVIRNIPFESYGDNTELIAVNVSLKNIIENTRMFYDQSLRLLVNGVEYGDTYNSDEAYKPNFEGSITGGGKIHIGNIFFKIPKDVTNLKIQYTNKEYDPDLDGDKTVIYRIDI